jgi:hypothetical protein
MYKQFVSTNQFGGAKCSLCGSPGTNKSTCPLNPSSTKPNPTTHPLALIPQVSQVSQVSQVPQVSQVARAPQVSQVSQVSRVPQVPQVARVPQQVSNVKQVSQLSKEVPTLSSPKKTKKALSPLPLQVPKNKKALSPLPSTSDPRKNTSVQQKLEESGPLSFDFFPDEIKMLVMMEMDPITLLNTCRINKAAKSLCNDDKFWKDYSKQHLKDIMISSDNQRSEEMGYFSRDTKPDQIELVKKDPNLSWKDLFLNMLELSNLWMKYKKAEQTRGDTEEAYVQFINKVDEIGKKGWIDVFRPFLYTKYEDEWMDRSAILRTGLRNNLTEVLDHIVANRYNSNARGLYNSWSSFISEASPEAALYLQKKGVILDRPIFGSAVAKGNLPLVELLVSKGAKPSANDLEWAIGNRHIPMIQYLWSLGMDKRIGANLVWDEINHGRSEESQKKFDELLQFYIDNGIFGGKR